MPQSTTTASGVHALLRHAEQKLVAIDAIAAGRLTEAQRLILDLLTSADRPIVSGQCRYCGCTDERPCAIAIPPDELGNEPVVARCSWWDGEQTVCSRLSCIQRHAREQRGLVVDGDEPASRIVMP